MTTPGDKNSPAILNAFLKLYLEDQERGDVRPLAEYQERFPGYEEQVAERYASLQESGETAVFKAATLDIPAQEDDETLAAPAPGEKSGTDGAGSMQQAAHPQKIGPYRLLRPLGEGGMGIVYLAEQTEPIKRQVALKLVRSGLTSEEFLVRFEAERQAIALMSHVNIARVFDAGTAPDGNPYFAMEYAPGVPLKSYCEEKKLTLSERLDLFLQVCSGVRHAHQKGIIHRDLKPSNILVGNDGEKPLVKIIDFGVARSMDQRLTDKALETEAGQMVGTPEYMSPEQAEMGPAGIDTRTDVYALGVILYELLCGLLPFDSETLRSGGYTEMKWLICEVDPPKPSRRLEEFDGKDELGETFGLAQSSLVRRLQGDLDWITMKAIDKDRSQRYQSAGDLTDDIRRHLLHDPVLAGPPTPGYKLRKFARKHRIGLLAAASLLVICSVIATLTWQASVRENLRQRMERSSAKLDQAEKHHSEYLALSGKLRQDTRSWKENKARHPDWLPVWEPATIKLLEDSQEIHDTRSQLDSEFAAALKAIYGALQEAPEDSAQVARVQENLAGLFASRGQQGLRQSDKQISTEFFSLPLREAGRPLSLEIRSEPAGAGVYLYRYIEHEFRLLPVPFHSQRDESTPDEQLHDRAILEFEAVHNPPLYAAQFEEGAGRFAPGDRFLSIGETRLRSRTDLAGALQGLSLDATVEVTVLRDGKKHSVSWKPFSGELAEYPDENGRTTNPLLWKSKLKEGKVLNIYQQFGFTFTGVPLPRGSENHLGTTPVEHPIKLPPGSYLLLLDLQGRPTVRVPLVVPGQAAKLDVQIPPEVPDGFLYVPAGPFFGGGDDQDFAQNLEPGQRELPGFFMGRLEVNFTDYLAFVNSPEILARTDEDGHAPRKAGRGRKEAGLEKILLIPSLEGQLLFNRSTSGGKWNPIKSVANLKRPVIGVSMLAAMEYAQWLSSKSPGKKYSYRLPTDLEWEKAARGVDRRIHVWGKYPVSPYCRSGASNCRNPNTLGNTGVFPLDESVYGIRDLAGSVSEPTTDLTVAGQGFISYRGGHWLTIDEYLFHAATRTGRLADTHEMNCGFRLVAVPTVSAKPGEN